MLLLHLFSNNGPISALKLDVPIYSPLLCLDYFSSSTLSIALAAVRNMYGQARPEGCRFNPGARRSHYLLIHMLTSLSFLFSSL